MFKKKFSIMVVGNVAVGNPVFNGQTAKTRDYIYYLKKRFGQDKVSFFDTNNWKKGLFRKIIKLVCCLLKSKIVVLVLGDNGRQTILPLATFLKKVSKNIVLFSVVGGSLMYSYDREKKVSKCLKKVDGVFVETKSFHRFLMNKGLNNSFYSPVFSKRESKTLDDIPGKLEPPFRFCTYSRVCKEKGIDRAMNEIARINNEAGSIVCTLDIYGHPSPEYREEFEANLKKYNAFVFNHPYLDDKNAIDELSSHYMMLFPTSYKGEGFPIGVVECYKSCLPVIASNWHFNSEIVKDRETGLLFDLEKDNDLYEKIVWAIKNPEMIIEMKKRSLLASHDFDADNALLPVYTIIEGNLDQK